MSIPAALLTLVKSAVPTVTVYDGRVPDTTESEPPPQRYVVVYIDGGTRSTAEAVVHRSTSITHRWQVTCVAPDREMSAWLADQVRDVLTDVRLNVPGWQTGLVAHTFSQLPQPDEQVQERPVVVAHDTYRLTAERLPDAES